VSEEYGSDALQSSTASSGENGHSKEGTLPTLNPSVSNDCAMIKAKATLQGGNQDDGGLVDFELAFDAPAEKEEGGYAILDPVSAFLLPSRGLGMSEGDSKAIDAGKAKIRECLSDIVSDDTEEVIITEMGSNRLDYTS